MADGGYNSRRVEPGCAGAEAATVESEKTRHRVEDTGSRKAKAEGTREASALRLGLGGDYFFFAAAFLAGAFTAGFAAALAAGLAAALATGFAALAAGFAAALAAGLAAALATGFVALAAGLAAVFAGAFLAAIDSHLPSMPMGLLRRNRKS